MWSRLTFAGAAVFGVAGRSLAGRCAMLGQVDGLGFPGADPPAVWSGWKAEPHGPAGGDQGGSPRLACSIAWGLPRNGPAAIALGIEAEWRKRAKGVVPAQPKARPEGQRPSLSFLLPY